MLDERDTLRGLDPVEVDVVADQRQELEILSLAFSALVRIVHYVPPASPL